LVVYDEIWGFESEKARRLYEELTPPPTESSAWILIVTYAGFVGESDLFESIYQRGLAARRVDTELECYENDELFMRLTMPAAGVTGRNQESAGYQS
jgi:hypothetical protein